MRGLAAVAIGLVVYFSGPAAQADLVAAARSDVEILVVGHTLDKHGKPVKVGGICSGVYLGDGIVASAKHCFNGEGDKNFNIDKIEVVLDNNGRPGGKFDAHVSMSNRNADVALLQVTKDLPADKAQLACREPVIGEQLELVGNPLGVEFIHTWGRVAGVRRNADDTDTNLVPVDVSIVQGNSGGPAYDKDGKVLGLADMVIRDSASGEVKFLVSSLALCNAPPILAEQASAGPGTDE